VLAVKVLEGAPVAVDCPPPAGDGVKVRVASAGICGSDLHLLEWELPVVMGHEMAGTLADGTPVAVEPLDPCGACPACLAGSYNLCQLGPTMVFGVGRDGGMAEMCVVPESAISPLPAGLSPADACLVEPLAVAVHGVRRAGLSGGQRAAVVGGGSIGQLALVAAQAAGATVSLEARHEAQRSVATRLGSREVTGGYDVVIEAAGTAGALERAAELCRPGGTLVLLGTYWEQPPMPAMGICMREVSVVPAYMYGRAGPSKDFDIAATLLAARPELPGLLITHRFPLNAAAEAFATARDRAAGAIKVVLEP
jgi:threonine dehydrogenase-like Zn-dependent dehydrogenase